MRDQPQITPHAPDNYTSPPTHLYDDGPAIHTHTHSHWWTQYINNSFGSRTPHRRALYFATDALIWRIFVLMYNYSRNAHNVAGLVCNAVFASLPIRRSYTPNQTMATLGMMKTQFRVVHINIMLSMVGARESPGCSMSVYHIVSRAWRLMLAVVWLEPANEKWCASVEDIKIYTYMSFGAETAVFLCYFIISFHHYRKQYNIVS